MRAFARWSAIGAATGIAFALSLSSGVSTASADNYFTNITSQFANGRHVYQDPNAVPHITPGQVQQLENEITSTHKSIYLVLVGSAPTGAANELPAQAHAALGKKGVYAVSSPGGFYAQAFGVPKAIADNAPQLAHDAVANGKARHSDGKAVPYEVFTGYVTSIAGVHASQPAVQDNAVVSTGEALPAVATVESSEGPNLVLWGAIGVIVVLILAWVFTNAGRRRDSEYAPVYSRNDPPEDPDEYDPPVYRSPGPQDTPRRTYAPPTGSDRPTGRSSQPSAQPQSHPQRVQTVTYNHYFGGGYSGGMLYGPGYYSDPFWNFMVMDSLLNHNQSAFDRDGYNQGFVDGGHHEDSSSGQSDYTSTDSGGGSWSSSPDPTPEPSNDTPSGSDGSSDSSSSGGDSWSSSPDPAPEPSYDPPSSDTSSAGGDWGGSSDSGSSDSGSYDSGSSDSGSSGGDGW